MPEISRFLGVVVLMHFREHNPPHFHARYNEFEAAMPTLLLIDQAKYLGDSRIELRFNDVGRESWTYAS